MQRTSINGTVSQGEIKVMGNASLTSKLESWLCASPLSRLGALDELPELHWAQ